jgi:hypothetical protein
VLHCKKKEVDQLPVKSKKLAQSLFYYLVVSDDNENTIKKRTSKGNLAKPI